MILNRTSHIFRWNAHKQDVSTLCDYMCDYVWFHQ